MYYKLVKDGKIVDVQKSKEFAYVRMDPERQIPFRCAQDDPDVYGMISSDSSVIYLLEEIEVKEISSQVYEELRAELDASRIPDDISEAEEQEDVDRPPTREELNERIEFLEACILEMSEILYE